MERPRDPLPLTERNDAFGFIRHCVCECLQPSPTSVNPSTPGRTMDGVAKALRLLLMCCAINSGLSTSLEDDCLDIHNKYRTTHQAPAVTWSPLLTEHAYNWSVYLASINSLKHESGGFSDNLYMAYGKVPDTPCTKAVTAFYSEVQYYDYADPLAQWARTGHFTQVVWKETTEIGAAAKEFIFTNSKGKNFSKFVVVVKYRPAGNFITKKKFQANVLPPLPEAPSTTALIPQPTPTFTPMGTTSPTPSLESLEGDCLEVHNRLRAKHQSPAVMWSPLLAEHAYNWSVHLASTNALKHESDGFSDNLYMADGRAPKRPCGEAVTEFYSEVDKYDYDVPLARPDRTSRFTQVVWKATTEIGAAYTEYNYTTALNQTTTKFVLVVKYRPAGNVVSEDEYKNNVLPPVGDGDSGVQKTIVSFPLSFGLVTYLVAVYL